MIESNNKKTFICISFYTADKKLCKYEKFFGEKSKKQDKIIQFRTLGQHTKNQDCPSKTRTVGMFTVKDRLIQAVFDIGHTSLGISKSNPC